MRADAVVEEAGLFFIFLLFQRLVVFFDGLGVFGADALKQGEQLLWVEGIELVVGPGARLAKRPVDDDDGDGRSE